MFKLVFSLFYSLLYDAILQMIVIKQLKLHHVKKALDGRGSHNFEFLLPHPHYLFVLRAS